MARIVLASQAASGHVRPFTSVSRRLVRRGHDVVWYCGEAFEPAITRSGARYTPPDPGSLIDLDQLEIDHLELAGLSGPARAAWFIKNVFAAPVAGQYRDLKRIVDDIDPDVIVADSTLLGAALVHEIDRRLWATLSVAPLAIPDPDVPPFGPGWPPGDGGLYRARNRMFRRMMEQTVLRGATQRMNRERAKLRLPPVRSVFDANATPYLYMQATSPAFEYPRREPPPQLHFVGPLFPEPSADEALPDWWPDLDGGRPVVLVTQGTLSTAENDLIVPAVQALMGVDIIVLATTDRPPSRFGLDPPPANLRTAPFLPFDQLMPKLAAVVTNGGYGTVQLALRHGVPLVVTGQTEDKPEVCARVAWSGTGIDLRTSRPESSQLAGAVRKVIAEDRYRAAARLMAADFATYDAPANVAELLERLVATRRAVTIVGAR